MSIWQTKQWQEMLKKSGQVEKTIEIENIFIEKRKLKFGQNGLFVFGIRNNQITKVFIKNLKNICKKEKSLFFQIETYDYSQENLEKIDFKKLNLENKKYKEFITENTAIINLEKTEEEILTLMKPKGRYNIRLAEKKGVKIFEADKTEKNIKIFYDLMIETISRDKFLGNTFSYYKTFLEKLDFSKLFFAEFEGKIISAGIFTYFDEVAIYYYGASTSEKKYRNLMAPYLLQWEAIKIGKSKNCKIYDFLGIAGGNEKELSLAGVTDFKLKFTKNTLKVSNSFLFINKKIIYFFFNILRKIKK